MKKIIRLNYTSIPEYDVCYFPENIVKNMAMVDGALVVLQDEENQNWAYGYHIKSAGGMTFNEHHILLKKSEKSWDFKIGDYLVNSIDNSDLISTSIGLDDFNIDNALRCFNLLDVELEKIIKIGHLFDIDIDEPYSDFYLCEISNFKNVKEEKIGYFGSSEYWYSNEINFNDLNIKDVSDQVPGNMCFIK